MKVPMDDETKAFFLAAADHAAAGRTQEAENGFAAVLLKEPTLHIARFQLGLLQWSAGRTGAALVTWQPLADLPQGHDLGHFARAFMLWCSADTDAAAAELQAGIDCCRNEALVADMQAVRDTVRAVAPQASPNASLHEAGEEEARHVLLANYVNPGLPN